MKKTLCFLVFFVLLGLVLYADEDNENTNRNERGRFDIGAGYTFTNNPKLHGGHLEFGINLYRNIFYIQNRFLFRAGGFKTDDLDSTVLSLSEKLVFGRMAYNSGIYLYAEGGAGFYGNADKGFSADTLVYSLGFGGGLEFGAGMNGGLYVEVGYLGQKITTNFLLSGVAVQTGYRIFL
jgi:hypothetical protein